MSFAPRNRSLLERLRLFVIARPENLAHFDRRPFDIAPAAVFDPLARSSCPFLGLLERLDAITFGPEGMPMPRWVFLDGAEMTGAIAGFAAPAAELGAAARELFDIDDGYAGLVPFAMFIAIPTFEPGIWFAHNLASVASLLPGEALGGLGSLTKAVALRMFRARAQIGATQWHSRALFVHTRLGPLELITAHTPAHGDADTLTYRAEITEEALRHLGRDPRAEIAHPEPDEWIDSGDLDRRIALQEAIEAGERFAVAGRPETTAAGLRVPIVRR